MEKIIIIVFCVFIIFVLLILDQRNRKIVEIHKKDNKKSDDWVERHLKMAEIYETTHKRGTRVVAKSKDGSWKEGQIIGNHDWSLWTFFFMVKFDDGEIIKQSEHNVSLL